MFWVIIFALLVICNLAGIIFLIVPDLIRYKDGTDWIRLGINLGAIVFCSMALAKAVMKL